MCICSVNGFLDRGLYVEKDGDELPYVVWVENSCLIRTNCDGWSICSVEDAKNSEEWKGRRFIYLTSEPTLKDINIFRWRDYTLYHFREYIEHVIEQKKIHKKVEELYKFINEVRLLGGPKKVRGDSNDRIEYINRFVSSCSRIHDFVKDLSEDESSKVFKELGKKMQMPGKEQFVIDKWLYTNAPYISELRDPEPPCLPRWVVSYSEFGQSWDNWVIGRHRPNSMNLVELVFEHGTF